jgi:hypothetical protein
VLKSRTSIRLSCSRCCYDLLQHISENYVMLYRNIPLSLARPFQIIAGKSFMFYTLHKLGSYKSMLLSKERIKVTVVNDMMPCSFVDRYQCVGGTSYLHPQDSRVNRKFHPFSIFARTLSLAKMNHFRGTVFHVLPTDSSPCPPLPAAVPSFVAQLMPLA